MSAKKSGRPKKPLAGQSPIGQHRGWVKRDGQTVLAGKPSSKTVGARGMDGETPYFRFYADSWRARLSGLPAHAQALVLQAAAVGWAEKKGGPLRLTEARWCAACGCTKEQLREAVSLLLGLEWIEVASDSGGFSLSIPDLAKQSKLVTYERDKKRAQRAGQSQGRIDRSRDRGTEGPREPVRGPAPTKPPATDEQKHAILQAAIANIGRPKEIPK